MVAHPFTPSRRLVLASLAASLSACSSVGSAEPGGPVTSLAPTSPAPATAQAAPVVPSAEPPGAPPPQAFRTWLEAFRAEALRAGIRRETVERSLSGLAPIQRVIELDRAQPERTQTFEQYITRVINDVRINRARDLRRQHDGVLRQVAQRFGVPPRFVIALWGLESDFGRITGNFPIIAALATLAWEGRRAQLFRSELLEALRVVDSGAITAEAWRGSWAGASGQSQFMPSSYRRFAVDFNGDGRADIWSNEADVFASIANYLGRSGWNARQTWGHAVSLSQPIPQDRTGIDIRRPVGEWLRNGVRFTGAAGDPALEASLVRPGGVGGRAWLVYGNYRVVMQWNRSTFFATSVGLLADHIEAA
ncbi:MAG: lytic murein transglycosylase [Alphaproteobacteria bacterium]|nr:MAG: lytic murein transglycosylase [Alphaproteobacteria bacterium]